jgi:hypothetical protein
MVRLVTVIGAVTWLGVCGAEPEGEDVDSLIPWLLDHRAELVGVPFGEVIKATTGHRIIAVDEEKDREILETLGEAIGVAEQRLNRVGHPIHGVGRVNEASRHIEDELREVIGGIEGWSCGVPTTVAGKEQRSGYPDLRIVTPDGRVVFLDPKLFRAGSRESSLRTFYFEPRSATSKVREDAVHLLVGFQHNGERGTDFRLLGWEIVDLSRLQVRLKAEFQASNRDIYVPAAVVGKSESLTVDSAD